LATADSAIAKKHMKACQKNGMDKLKAGLTFTRDVDTDCVDGGASPLLCGLFGVTYTADVVLFGGNAYKSAQQ